jgi:hypothetical protein
MEQSRSQDRKMKEERMVRRWEKVGMTRNRLGKSRRGGTLLEYRRS